eukprot:510306-Prorocentrum_minimum.AAC.1
MAAASRRIRSALYANITLLPVKKATPQRLLLALLVVTCHQLEVAACTSTTILLVAHRPRRWSGKSESGNREF